MAERGSEKRRVGGGEGREKDVSRFIEKKKNRTIQWAVIVIVAAGWGRGVSNPSSPLNFFSYL